MPRTHCVSEATPDTPPKRTRRAFIHVSKTGRRGGPGLERAFKRRERGFGRACCVVRFEHQYQSETVRYSLIAVARTQPQSSQQRATFAEGLTDELKLARIEADAEEGQVAARVSTEPSPGLGATKRRTGSTSARGAASARSRRPGPLSGSVTGRPQTAPKAVPMAPTPKGIMRAS